MIRTISVPILTIFSIAIFCSNNSLQAHDIAKELHDATKVLLAALEDQQLASIKFEFDDELRQDWQFVPMERKGLSFGSMKPNQRLLAMSLIQTALSHRGFSQSMQIMALEQILHELENQAPKRNPEAYHLFLFGEPSLEKSWGWRIEGHHLSLSFTIVAGEDGQNVVSTPAFFGSNPAEVKSGSQKGLRVLGIEEDFGRSLIKQLSVEQKRSAIIAEEAPRDVINGPSRDAQPLEPAGIAGSELNPEQQKLLRQLIDSFVNKIRTELAQSDWKKIEEAGFEKIHFAWAGKIQPGQPHYFRVQGPTFILEYDNTQNKANHAHSVWRDFKNDFGADLLRQHYEQKSHSK